MYNISFNSRTYSFGLRSTIVCFVLKSPVGQYTVLYYAVLYLAKSTIQT
jgi:hypothetical protein